jgi:hypothetical protein
MEDSRRRGYAELISRPRYIRYDTARYDFIGLFARDYARCTGDLSQLHTAYADVVADLGLMDDEAAATNALMKMHYDSPLRGEFLAIYARFVREVICPLFDEDVVFWQTKPTLRIALPGNTALGTQTEVNFRHMSERTQAMIAERKGAISSSSTLPRLVGMHCDSDYGHPDGEVNFVLALSAMHGDNTIVYESHPPGSGDFANRVEQAYGSVFCNWFNQIRHANVISGGDCGTRVSVDFRCIPASKWDPEAFACGESLTAKVKYAEGGYFMRWTRPKPGL